MFLVTRIVEIALIFSVRGGEDFAHETFDAFLGELALRVDGAGLEIPGKRGAGLLVEPAFKLAGGIERLGDIRHLGGEQFELAAEFRIVGKLLAQFGELFPCGVALAHLAELGGLAERGLDLGEIADDLLEGILAGGVALDGGCQLVLAARDLAVVALGEQAVEIIAGLDERAGVGNERAEFRELRIGGPDLGGGFDFLRGLLRITT